MKKQLLRGEAQFMIAGKITAKLSKFPGKRGAISSYADAWSVVLEVEQGNNTTVLTLLDWREDRQEAAEYYDRLKSQLEKK